MALALCAGDLACGCVNTQLLILSSMRLVLCWSSGPVWEDVAAEGLEIKLAFPGGTEEAVPVSFVQNGYGTTSTTHTLVACDSDDIDQDRRGGDVIISSDVVWRRLGRESV